MEELLIKNFSKLIYNVFNQVLPNALITIISCSKNYGDTNASNVDEETIKLRINDQAAIRFSIYKYMENDELTCNFLVEMNNFMPIGGGLKINIKNINIAEEYSFNNSTNQLQLYFPHNNTHYIAIFGIINITECYPSGSRTGAHGRFDCVVVDSLENKLTLTNAIF